MKAVRAGEALLRSPQSSTLLPFLAPTAHRTTSAPTQRRHRNRTRPWQSTSTRTFSSSVRTQQDAPTDAFGIPRRAASQSTDNDISALLDSALDGTKGTPSAPASRTSRFKSPSAQRSNPPSRQAAAGSYPPSRGADRGANQYRPPPGSAVSEIFGAMLGDSTPRSQPSRSGFTDIASMLDPRDRTSASTRNTGPPPILAQKVAPMQLGPRAGRTVHIDLDRNMDVGRAFRALEMQCARNSVRRDFMRQRFHERAGLKRKRLKGERWRRRFREGFRGVVKLVQKMRKQGW